MSRAKVTRYITELENWLHCRLFNRSTRMVSLTVAGEMHLKEAIKILELTDNFQNKTSKATQTPCGIIRIATSVAFGEAHLGKAVILFLERYPDVRVDLIIDDNCIDLVENRIDIAIRTSSTTDLSLIAKPISSAKAIICASPNYLKRHPAIQHPRDLESHKVILCTNLKSYQNWTFTHKSMEVNIELDPHMTSNDILVLSRSVLAGGGIAQLPCFLAGPLIEKGELQQVLADWETFDLKVWAVYASRNHQPAAVKSFIDFLIDYFD